MSLKSRPSFWQGKRWLDRAPLVRSIATLEEREPLPSTDHRAAGEHHQVLVGVDKRFVVPVDQTALFLAKDDERVCAPVIGSNFVPDQGRTSGQEYSF